MTVEKHENANLLFLLNGIMRTVLQGLEGEYAELAKIRFEKVVETVDGLEKALLDNCEPSAQEEYCDASIKIGSLLNKAISALNEGNLQDFLVYCNKFKIK